MADVNSDGYLDIYVCRSFSDHDAAKRKNLLYINNGDLTFTEEAEKYGIDDGGYGTQAAFFDYDLDGDLDLYVGNHPRIIPRLYHDKTKNPQRAESDKLYKNNGDGTFTDVTIISGILNWGWLLGVSIGDFNKDGWPDIYVSVDHSEPDLYYINNGDGTFTNQVDKYMKHISGSAMGIDVADFNNDGLLDIYVVEMMPIDNLRKKTQMASMDPSGFWWG